LKPRERDVAFFEAEVPLLEIPHNAEFKRAEKVTKESLPETATPTEDKDRRRFW
jgi:hypothetical protein